MWHAGTAPCPKIEKIRLSGTLPRNAASCVLQKAGLAAAPSSRCAAQAFLVASRASPEISNTRRSASGCAIESPPPPDRCETRRAQEASRCPRPWRNSGSGGGHCRPSPTSSTWTKRRWRNRRRECHWGGVPRLGVAPRGKRHLVEEVVGRLTRIGRFACCMPRDGGRPRSEPGPGNPSLFLPSGSEAFRGYLVSGALTRQISLYLCASRSSSVWFFGLTAPIDRSLKVCMCRGPCLWA